MTDVKHTAGPWHWVIHDHSCASLGVGDDPGMGTPLVMSSSPCRACADRAKDGKWEWGRCTTPSEANARLIAAAPDLLDALKMVVSDSIDIECGDRVVTEKQIEHIESAIAKATNPTS